MRLKYAQPTFQDFPVMGKGERVLLGIIRAGVRHCRRTALVRVEKGEHAFS